MFQINDKICLCNLAMDISKYENYSLLYILVYLDLKLRKTKK